MPVNTQKLVRVLAAVPVGPTGSIEQVHILSTFTGPTGTFPVYGQVSAAQQAAGGPTGTFKEVVALAGTGPAGRIKTIIIPGYVGPA
jgi:hypothetical protein